MTVEFNDLQIVNRQLQVPYFIVNLIIGTKVTWEYRVYLIVQDIELLTLNLFSDAEPNKFTFLS